MPLQDKYSPPYTITLLAGTPDEAVLTFKRMLRREWKGLAEEWKTKLIEAEAAKINVEMKDSPQHERGVVRTRMRDHFAQVVTHARVINDCSQTEEGIDRLLNYSLVEKDRAEYLSILTNDDIVGIMEEIVYLPIVIPSDPQKLPPQPEASSGGSEANPSIPTGTDTTPTLNPSSPASTPTD